MKYNIGFTDTLLRVMFAIFVVMLTIFGMIAGTTAVVLNLVGVVLFITALAGVCPIYRILGISTRAHTESEGE